MFTNYCLLLNNFNLFFLKKVVGNFLAALLMDLYSFLFKDHCESDSAKVRKGPAGKGCCGVLQDPGPRANIQDVWSRVFQVEVSPLLFVGKYVPTS